MSCARRASAMLLALTLLLAACGNGDQPASVTWRNVSLDLPDGWYLVEDEPTRLTIASHDLFALFEDQEPVAPDTDEVVGMFFTYRPGVVPDDWRRHLDAVDATVESDTAVTLDGEVPATRFVYSYVTNDIPTREMVLIVPSRGIELIAQPVPTPGDDDAPEVFLEYVDTFAEVLDTVSFGPPQLD